MKKTDLRKTGLAATVAVTVLAAGSVCFAGNGGTVYELNDALSVTVYDEAAIPVLESFAPSMTGFEEMCQMAMQSSCEWSCEMREENILVTASPEKMQDVVFMLDHEGVLQAVWSSLTTEMENGSLADTYEESRKFGAGCAAAFSWFFYEDCGFDAAALQSRMDEFQEEFEDFNTLFTMNYENVQEQMEEKGSAFEIIEYEKMDVLFFGELQDTEVLLTVEYQPKQEEDDGAESGGSSEGDAEKSTANPEGEDGVSGQENSADTAGIVFSEEAFRQLSEELLNITLQSAKEEQGGEEVLVISGEKAADIRLDIQESGALQSASIPLDLLDTDEDHSAAYDKWAVSCSAAFLYFYYMDCGLDTAVLNTRAEDLQEKHTEFISLREPTVEALTAKLAELPEGDFYWENDDLTETIEFDFVMVELSLEWPEAESMFLNAKFLPK